MKRNNAQQDCAVWLKRANGWGRARGYGGLKPPLMPLIGAASRPADTKNGNRIAVITP